MGKIIFEVRDHVGVVTLNRPEARNAVDPETTAELTTAFDTIEADAQIWVGVLAGVPPVFCAGADLKVIQSGRTDGISNACGFGGFTRRARTKVMIAAVDGPALAGGMELVLACDLIIASQRAQFGLPEAKRSLVANAGGLLRLPRKIPIAIAMEMCITGDPISASRAYELGLVNEICDPGMALAQALALAGRVVANPPIAVRATRKVIDQLSSEPALSEWQISQDAYDEVFESDDRREGLEAFFEKRPPQWTGR